MHLFHKWHLWSKPFDQEYEKFDALSNMHMQVQGKVQERTCATCGKYQWRSA